MSRRNRGERLRVEAPDDPPPIFAGPDGWKCERCGKACPQPELPLPIDGFLAFNIYLMYLHQHCKPAGAS